MRGGTTGLLVCALLWLSATGVPLEAEEKMEETTDAPQRSVRKSSSLSAGEQDYVDRRKRIVLEALGSLGINSTSDDVPHIALLASGGGQRSAVAVLGALHQLEIDGLMGTLLYFAGVSGSTWSMSFLYSDPKWSTNMSGSITRLATSEVELEQTLAWLDLQAQKEDFSLSQVWGALTSAGIMRQLDERHLSNEADRDGSNPYPVYCAIESYFFENGPIQGQWFEVTPHEAGFTEMGLFVETSLLGSRFQDGQLRERRSEMDMVELQGVLGSALADEETVTANIPAWLQAPGLLDLAAIGYLRFYNSLTRLLGLCRGTLKDYYAISAVDALRTALRDKVHGHDAALWASMTADQRKLQSQEWKEALMTAAEVWSQNLENGTLKAQVVPLIRKVRPLIEKWEWGTTANFLYQFNDPSVPPYLRSQENINLIDAGLFINAPYPSFLGEKRDIDLIIAAEYSAGDMFETLTLTRNYTAALQKPFTPIDDSILQDRDWPKDCYVLEGGDQSPTIVYLPLFNRRNCKDAAEVRARMTEYATFHLPFDQEKTDFLLETARANVRNNRETLLREINKAALRRQIRNRVAAAAEQSRAEQTKV